MKKKASDLYSSAKEAASSKLGGFKAAVNELAEGDTPVVQGEAFRCPRCSRALGMDAKRCSKCGTTTDGVDKAESAAVLSAAKAEAASAAEQKALDAGLHPEAAKAVGEAASVAIHKGKTSEEAVAAGIVAKESRDILATLMCRISADLSMYPSWSRTHICGFPARV